MKRTQLKKGTKGLSKGKGLKKSIKTKEEVEQSKEQKRLDNEFYLSVWSEREHRCENCECNLGEEPLTIFFDHILEKSRWKELRYKNWNIMLLCANCHHKKSEGFPSQKMMVRRIETLFRASKG